MGKAKIMHLPQRKSSHLSRPDHTWEPCRIIRIASHLNKQYVAAGFSYVHGRLLFARLFTQLAVVLFIVDSSQRQHHHPRVLHAFDPIRVRAGDSLCGLGAGIHESGQ